MCFGLTIIIFLTVVGSFIALLGHPITLLCILTIVTAVFSSAIFEGLRVYNLEGDDYLNHEFL